PNAADRDDAGRRRDPHSGERPVNTRDRFCLLTNAPMRPRAEQKSPDLGLLDECIRNQTDLF
ncbi:hypothetical protein, partial [Mesorhizobium sp.]|uniref:hypothetical protein n=1 Tax=Mesorhizobium sp. TaxID=1871066 RepID=UPI0025FA2EC7